MAPFRVTLRPVQTGSHPETIDVISWTWMISDLVGRAGQHFAQLSINRVSP